MTNIFKQLLCDHEIGLPIRKLFKPGYGYLSDRAKDWYEYKCLKCDKLLHSIDNTSSL